MEKIGNNKKALHALLTDLSKPFDCVSHNLHIAKVTCTRTVIYRVKIDARLSPILQTKTAKQQTVNKLKLRPPIATVRIF